MRNRAALSCLRRLCVNEGQHCCPVQSSALLIFVLFQWGKVRKMLLLASDEEQEMSDRHTDTDGSL